jgi:tRNA A37 threonylcarbamoyladenosine dehydratase
LKNQFTRTEMLIGKENLEKLKNSRVAVFGVGGVGGYTVEALVRAGVGTLDLIDSDRVDITNLNRQIIATHSTIGRLKVEVARDRALDINPDIKINTHAVFFSSENAADFDFSKYDYIVDAIDSVTSKIQLILKAKEADTPIISSMGMGNKLDPTLLQVTDISKTSVCRLARVMRYELRRRGVTHLKVVYSKEPPIKPNIPEGEKIVPGSISFVPAAAGLIIAGEVVREIISKKY